VKALENGKPQTTVTLVNTLTSFLNKRRAKEILANAGGWVSIFKIIIKLLNFILSYNIHALLHAFTYSSP